MHVIVFDETGKAVRECRMEPAALMKQMDAGAFMLLAPRDRSFVASARLEELTRAQVNVRRVLSEAARKPATRAGLRVFDHAHKKAMQASARAWVRGKRPNKDPMSGVMPVGIEPGRDIRAK